MITHTEAIVFRAVDYQESSKIVTLFTKEHGKIAVLVRGAKKPKNKFSGLIEVGHLLDVIYYYKPSRSVQILSEASFAEKTLNIRTDFEKMATVISAMELIRQLLHDNEVNHRLFDFTRTMLLWVDQASIHPPLVFPYLQIRLAELTGIGLQQDPASDSDKPNYLNLDSGYISTKSTGSHSYKLTKHQTRFINLALQTRSSALFEIPFQKGELKALISHLDRYLRYHTEGLKERKSDAIFEQILQE